MSQTKFLISASLTDQPIIGRLDNLFREFKETGIDGLEIVLGFRSRFAYEKLVTYSRYYNLPILSIHQPLWSGVGLFFDKRFLHLAEKLNVKKIVFHPPPVVNLQSTRSRKYFEKLARLQKEQNIQIMLENMSAKYAKGRHLRILPSHFRQLLNIFSVYDIAEEFDFQLTFDTSHALVTSPHEEEWFPKMYPRIGNIHLSSFTGKKVHLPLSMGDFASQSFVSYLKQKNYTGLVTLEIYYPKYVNLKKFDFQVIADSVKLIRETR